MEASDLTATQEEIATVARFLVWRSSQHNPCAEPEAISISDLRFALSDSRIIEIQNLKSAIQN
mgnify:FL=1